MQEKGESKMPDIKLPYNKAGMDMAETLEKEVEAMGGEVSYDYPSEDALNRVENYHLGGLVENNLNPMMSSDLQMGSKFEPKFEYGGKVKKKKNY